jgi:hypothetical protein
VGYIFVMSRTDDIINVAGHRLSTGAMDSGKVLRGTMRSIANGEHYTIPATIDDPAILDEISEGLLPIPVCAKRKLLPANPEVQHEEGSSSNRSRHRHCGRQLERWKGLE